MDGFRFQIAVLSIGVLIQKRLGYVPGHIPFFDQMPGTPPRRRMDTLAFLKDEAQKTFRSFALA
jgi:hypothetical protein